MKTEEMAGQSGPAAAARAESTSPLWRRTPTWLALFALGLSMYLLTLPADLRNNGDTIDRFLVTRSIVNNGSIQVGCNPGDNRVVVGRHGRCYAIYGPGQTVAMVPLYVVGEAASGVSGVSSDFATAVAAHSLDAILAALLLVFFYLLALQVGYRRSTAIVLTIILAFASTLWPDEQSGQEHTQIALALVVAVYAILKATQPHSEVAEMRAFALTRSRRWLLLAGLAAGFGIFTRYDFAVEVLILVCFLLWQGINAAPRPEPSHDVAGSKRRLPRVFDQLGWFLCGLAPFLLLDALWNTLRFGAPWRLGESASAQFGFPIVQGFFSLLVSPAKGLVWYLPLLWLLPLALLTFRRRNRALMWLILSLFASTVLFYANVAYWHGDPGWGPRYLFPLVPLLALPLGEVFERFPSMRLPARGVIIGVLGLSLALQLAAVSVDPWRFWYHLIQYRQHSAKKFVWKPTHYRYYWSRNPGLDPELYQFVAVADVAKVGFGDRSAAIKLYSGSATGPSGSSIQRYDGRQMVGVARRPLDTVSPLWLNDRYQWFDPLPVPLSLAARVVIIGILLALAGLSGLVLHLQFWSKEHETEVARVQTSRGIPNREPIPPPTPAQ